jgi:site-specific recombinase XerD
MAARRLNQESVDAPELALAQGPVPMSRLGGGIVDEAVLLDGYDSHLQLLENRPKTTAGTYRSHVKGFLRYMAINYPSVTLSDVTKLQVRAWFLHEANRGIAPVTRSTKLFAVRSFYRFLIAEDMSEENPASLVTLASPIRPRIEFYSDPEADAIIEWAAAQAGLRGRWVACSS